MFLILPKPEEILEYCALAVNLESYDEVSIIKNNETNLFSLNLAKQYDAHGSNQSVSYYTLGIFQTAEKCLSLFKDIVDALNVGQKTFELPPLSLSAQPEDSNHRDQRTAYN